MKSRVPTSAHDYVRMKIRRIRKSRGLHAVEVAQGCGMPRSSYASLEAGHYKMSLDNLFKILSFLEVDINDVWPLETIREDWVLCYRAQAFRLSEVCRLSESQGGALYRTSNGVCEVLLAHALPSDLLERIRLFLECGQEYETGVWFFRQHRQTTYSLFLMGARHRGYLEELVNDHFQIWIRVFSNGVDGGNGFDSAGSNAVAGIPSVSKS